MPDTTEGDSSKTRIHEVEINSRAAIINAKDWIEAAKEDYAFARGDQWAEEDRSKLDQEGRPVLTFNKIGAKLKLVTGYHRENDARIKVNPEGSEDKVFSEVIDKLLGFIAKRGDLSTAQEQQFDDAIICGKSILEMVIDYETDPLFGELKFQCIGPWNVFADPESKKYDKSDAEFMVKIVKLSRRKLIQMFPEKKRTIRALGDDAPLFLPEDMVAHEYDKDNYQNDIKRPENPFTAIDREDEENYEGDYQRFTLVEYWYKKYKTRYLVFDLQSRTTDIFSEEAEAKKFLKEQKAKGIPGSDQIDIIERELPEMWVRHVVNQKLLSDAVSPFEPLYNGFPFFWYVADWAPNAQTEDQRVKGVVRDLKDPQREVNKSRSQLLHILNTTANSGWIGDRDALRDNEWDELKQMGAKPGVVVAKKPGSQLQRIEPSGLSQADIWRGEKAEDEIKEISGINNELLAAADSNARSGRAMAIRIKQGVTILTPIFANFRRTKETIGSAILKLLPELIDAKKAVKIIGMKFLQTSGLSEGTVAAFLYQIKEARYDVLVSDADSSKTIRMEAFEQLYELFGQGAPIPMDLILEYSAIPNSEEVRARIQQEQQRQAQLAMAAKGPKPGDVATRPPAGP